YVLKRKDKLKGYIMGIPKKDHILVGPWVVDPKELEPQLLLQNLINNVDYKSIRIGILEKNQIALRLASNLKLSEYFFSIRMIYGKSFNQSNGVIAIAGPDRG
ncbi:MAG: hypothetical protein ACFFGP_13610, partial [Promethearchaeota archaeon]